MALEKIESSSEMRAWVRPGYLAPVRFDRLSTDSAFGSVRSSATVWSSKNGVYAG
jgi:hypothetical protein